MFNHGRIIFYDKAFGVLLYDSGEIRTSVENYAPDYYAIIPMLKNRDKDSIGVLMLEYGEYAEDFAEGAYIDGVNLETGKPLFVYHESGEPENPIEPQSPLSERLAKAENEVEYLRAADLDNKEMINGLAEIILNRM